MFSSVTQGDLRAQMEQHLLMVEEVLGGLDQFVQGLERRITRIEEGLGLEPEGLGYKSLPALSACQFRPQAPDMTCGLMRSTLR